MALGPLQDEFKKHTQEAAQMAAFRQQAIDMGFKGDETIAGVIKTAAAATKDAQGAITDRAEKQAKDRYDDAMFLAMLDDLDAQIAELDDQIEAIDARLEAIDSLIDILESGYDIDLNDPGHMRLLKQAGFDNDLDWPKIGLEELRTAKGIEQDNRLDLVERRDDIIHKRNELSIDFQARIANGESPEEAAEAVIIGSSFAETLAINDVENDALKAVRAQHSVDETSENSQNLAAFNAFEMNISG